MLRIILIVIIVINSNMNYLDLFLKDRTGVS